jgi:hypothetical protein
MPLWINSSYDEPVKEFFTEVSSVKLNPAGKSSFKKGGILLWFFKLKVLVDVTRESVEGFVKESIDTKSVLFTDKNPDYVNLEKMVENLIKVKSYYESVNGDLNWVHTDISNLKRNLLGIYHMVSEKYLQIYLK